MEALIRKDRRQILEIRSSLRGVRRIAVDRFHIQQRRELLRRAFYTPASFYDIPCLHVEAADLRRRYINVIFPWKEILAADKSKSVLHDFQDALCFDPAVQLLKIRAAKADPEAPDGAPGTVSRTTKDAIWVNTGEGKLMLKEVQLEGKKQMAVKDFLLGYKIGKGEEFQCL